MSLENCTIHGRICWNDEMNLDSFFRLITPADAEICCKNPLGLTMRLLILVEHP